MELATYDKDGYELECGEMRHKNAPETFHIPSLEERENLQIGDLVKLIFRMEQAVEEGLSVERMWVEITEKINGFYLGLLDNDPLGEVTLKCGDPVAFQHKHVIAIYEG